MITAVLALLHLVKTSFSVQIWVEIQFILT